jgi:hypothetical protein
VEGLESLGSPARDSCFKCPILDRSQVDGCPVLGENDVGGSSLAIQERLLPKFLLSLRGQLYHGRFTDRRSGCAVLCSSGFVCYDIR